MKGWSPLLALLGCACVQAADVPPGTQLAAEQAVVRHLKDEPASLSPLKLVGLPELQVLRDLYEGLLQKNADMLHMASVETAKESERGIVDMETLKHTNEQLISTLDEVLQIQTDGAKKRQEAEAELRRLEGELKQKLLQPRS